MDKDTATKVNEALVECYFKLHGSIDIVRERCSEDERKAYCRAIGKVLGYLLLDVLDPMYSVYPELRPALLDPDASDESPICGYCEQKPAVRQFTRKAYCKMVCATCFDRLSVQEALETKILDIESLESRGQYDEALAYLDAILQANRDRDHDGWLARSVAHHRAIIFLEAGRYVEAEQVHHAWAQLGFGDVSERWMHADGTARTLEALGRDQEALVVIEEALAYQDPKFLPSATWMLAALIHFSNKLGKPVDAKWLKLAEAVAERYGVEMPVRNSPGEAVLALVELTRGKQPKRPKAADEESGKK